MISFIIIGRNEGWKLIKCFESVTAAINKNKIKDYEVIYIDSDSKDESIDNAKKFDRIELIIFSIINNYNAAAARNIGANESTGEVLFFIDGDMEIEPEFLKHVLNDDLSLEYQYVSGQLIQHFYDENQNIIGQEKVFRNLTRDRKEKTGKD